MDYFELSTTYLTSRFNLAVEKLLWVEPTSHRRLIVENDQGVLHVLDNQDNLSYPIGKGRIKNLIQEFSLASLELSNKSVKFFFEEELEYCLYLDNASLVSLSEEEE